MRGGGGGEVWRCRPAERSSQIAPPLWEEHKAGRTPGREGERERRKGVKRCQTRSGRERWGGGVRARVNQEDQSEGGDPSHRRLTLVVVVMMVCSAPAGEPAALLG